MIKRPLFWISAAAFLACWAGIYASTPGREPREDLTMSIAMALALGFCPVFNLLKALGRSPVARHWAASLIVSIPSAVAVVLVVWSNYHPRSPASSWWFLIQLIALPLAWAAGRAAWENSRPLPNNSSKPTPLRGAA